MKCFRWEGRGSGEWTSRQKKKRNEDKTERVMGFRIRTREKIVRWNQMTALRFQIGGRHQILWVSIWGS